MGARTKARKRALDVLYAADLRGESGVEALERVTAEGEAPTNPYTAVLVRGVSEHQARIDEILEEFSTDWSLARMPASIFSRKAAIAAGFRMTFAVAICSGRGAHAPTWPRKSRIRAVTAGAAKDQPTLSPVAANALDAPSRAMTQGAEAGTRCTGLACSPPNTSDP